MKKVLSVILTIFMMFSIGTMVAGCTSAENSTSQTQELTDSEKVRNAVKGKALMQYMFYSIGDNKLKSSDATITNLDWNSDKTICTVSGKMKMIDVYGTHWTNNFDCIVTYSESTDKWTAGSFNYKSQSWSKN